MREKEEKGNLKGWKSGRMTKRNDKEERRGSKEII